MAKPKRSKNPGPANRTSKDLDERVSIPLPPDEAIRALLKVDPGSEPVRDGLPRLQDEPAGQYVPSGASGSEDAVDALIAKRQAECRAAGAHQLGLFDDPAEGRVILCSRCCGWWRTSPES